MLLGRRMSSVGLVCKGNIGPRRCRHEPTPQSAFIGTSSPAWMSSPLNAKRVSIKMDEPLIENTEMSKNLFSVCLKCSTKPLLQKAQSALIGQLNQRAVIGQTPQAHVGKTQLDWAQINPFSSTAVGRSTPKAETGCQPKCSVGSNQALI
ncbi:hypothetical protein DPX16_10745 [Anabarilius grahami]|uniref:Uncharacterized protein n=1 Tax=Anabarilius grahami TaxID=495550 RepID=A0A3N0Z7P5_ANAGA|nr:hypothetical protein DPX16_10745 [Anabarilius grahami]